MLIMLVGIVKYVLTVVLLVYVVEPFIPTPEEISRKAIKREAIENNKLREEVSRRVAQTSAKRNEVMNRVAMLHTGGCRAEK